MQANSNPPLVPERTGMALFATGLAGLALVSRRPRARGNSPRGCRKRLRRQPAFDAANRMA